MALVDREELGERLLAFVFDPVTETKTTGPVTVTLTADEIWTIYNALVP